MKKVLALAVLLALLASAFVIVSSAATAPKYWSLDSNCLIKVKEIEDDNGDITVPTFKAVKDDNTKCDGMIVGLPTYATVGDEFFEAKDEYYFIYTDAKGNELIYGDDHIGTADKLVVYDENDEIAATYGLVTYGDADGDGVFDVIDSSIAARCLNGFLDATEAPEVYEAVKTRLGMNNDLVEVEDYQQVVNDCIIGEIEENLKGRKTPIDQTIYFESIIYENTGAKRTAEFTAVDDNFKDLITINYNGSEEAPLASGIYSVTANVADSEKYLVTPGERVLGFIVIAPQNGTGYTTKVDNVNKKVIISINDAYSPFDSFNNAINNWCGSNYSLNVNNKAVSDHSNVLSALSPREYKVYSGQDTALTTDTSKEILGSYLPEDTILYEDYNTAREIPVSVAKGSVNGSFTIAFCQDEAVVKEAIRTYELRVASDGRGQRNTNTYNVECYGLRKNGERVISAVIRKSDSLLNALRGTGLKGMMVGYVDSIEFKATAKKGDYSNAKVTSLYNSGDGNTRYSKYSSTGDLLTKVYPMVKSFLKDTLGVTSTPTSTDGLKGRSGWAKYHCSIQKTGLRYGLEYKFEFIDQAGIAEVSYSIVTDSNIANGTITYRPDTSTKYSVYDSMVQYEIFYVNATPNSGYKTEYVKVVDVNGNEILPDEDGAYIMPASNVTVTAKFVAK